VRIAFLNWRDSTHPEGGGAEKYAETVCAGLAARGHEVTLLCARPPGSAEASERDGVRILRQGGRIGVYAASVRRLRRLERTEGPFDVVVDTQNGLPFWSVAATRTPVVVLVHHVHREQWPIVFGRATARLGWWLESVLAPRVYAKRPYVAVSTQTREELATLGVDPPRVAIIHNGTDVPLAAGVGKSAEPRIVVLGRLVPHKRVEHAVDVVARLAAEEPTLRLRIVGDGWWRERVAEHAREVGVADRVDILGFVDEETKHTELAMAWLALAPSVKEGWGLCVVEAASHATPTIAYHGTGGLSESIVDGESGLLVDDLDAMTSQVRALLHDAQARARLGAAARVHAANYTWNGTIMAWERLLTTVAAAKASGGSDEDETDLGSTDRT